MTTQTPPSLTRTSPNNCSTRAAIYQPECGILSGDTKRPRRCANTIRGLTRTFDPSNEGRG